ncbi:hypothetical protein CAP36_13740 [Chitinophagaceae bacterium IBVUCB2]|nr:hypothetical protein CAP36_13740 [Chitinophagaceae bacterium IBVUCB2]
MKKKQAPKIIMAGLLAITFFLQNLNAQTIDDIVEKHTQAMGGKEKLDSLKTITFEGVFILEGWELPLKAYMANTVGQRYDVMIMKVPSFIIATPVNGWQYFPIQGMKEPKSLNQEELDTYLPFMDLQGVLYNYKKKANAIEYAGIENVDESPCYKLVVKLNSGKMLTNFVDTATHFITKTVLQIKADGKESTLENRFANYQKTKDGFVFPFAMTLGPGQAFVSRIYINNVLDPQLFSPTIPASSEKK